MDEAVKDVADEKGLHRFRRGMQPDFARCLWADSRGYGPGMNGVVYRVQLEKNPYEFSVLKPTGFFKGYGLKALQENPSWTPGMQLTFASEDPSD